MAARASFLPYGRQQVDEADIAAVVEVLRSDWLTTGPMVEKFERAFAEQCGVAHAVAMCNGTAALHAMMAALGIGPGDEVIVPAITFVASANCVVYQGGTPVFADLEPDTLLLEVASVRAKITPRTKAIIAVDYAGQPCAYAELRALAAEHGLALVADACHALGGTYHGAPVGSLAQMSSFSLHPVKPITTGEGGMVTTDDEALAKRLRTFRGHGIEGDFRTREKLGAWAYEMVSLGYNLRLSDINCALGYTQLQKLPAWVAQRQALAAHYDAAFAGSAQVRPLVNRPGVTNGYHLYMVRVAGDRAEVFRQMRARNIGVNVHYLPVYLHPFYRERFGYGPGLCPQAEAGYAQLLTLPLHVGMSTRDVDDVVAALAESMAG